MLRTFSRFALFLIVFLATLPVFAAPTPTLTIGTGGAILIRGKPRIPFGLYHVSWLEDSAGSQRLGQSLLTDIGIIGSLGFPLLQFNVSSSPIVQLQLDRAAESGIVVIGEPDKRLWRDTEERQGNTATRVTRHEPQVDVWNIGDDINWRDPNRKLPLEPEELLHRNKLMKETAPQSLSYASGVALDAEHGSSIREMADYCGTVDLLGFTSYTLGEDTGIPEPLALEQTVRNFRAVEDGCATPDQALLAILQLVPLASGPQPTILEVRNGAYAALMHGFDGIMGYGFYVEGVSEPTYLPKTDTVFLGALATLAKEIDSLAPWITGGKRSHLPLTKEQMVHAAEWSQPDGRLVIVLSTERTKSTQIRLSELHLSLKACEMFKEKSGSEEFFPLCGSIPFSHNSSLRDSVSLTLEPGQIRIFRE
jgi:hypothetical protein